MSHRFSDGSFFIMQLLKAILIFMYRLVFMRIIISITCLFLFSAFHNKNDLKRIGDLENENKIISDSLIMQNKILKLVYDSLVEKEFNSWLRWHRI